MDNNPSKLLIKMNKENLFILFLLTVGCIMFYIYEFIALLPLRVLKYIYIYIYIGR